MVIRRPLGMLALVGAIASCSNLPTHPEGCSGDIQVRVDTHSLGPSRPLFSWTPRCGTSYVTAQPLVAGQRYHVDIGTTVGGDVLTAQGGAYFTP